MKCGNGAPVTVAPAVRSAGSRRFALKCAPDGSHTRVEEIIAAAGMFASLDGYRRYLAGTLAIRSHYEAVVGASGASRVWRKWPDRQVAGLVARDLTDLRARCRELARKQLKC